MIKINVCFKQITLTARRDFKVERQQKEQWHFEYMHENS